MPYRMWTFKLTCTQPECLGRKLTGAGLYKTVRRVLSIDGWYDMATEYLECRRCKKKVAGWSGHVLNQLDPAHRSHFPAILTYRLSCDMRVLRLMRERTLGNSATQLYNTLCEEHSEAWMQRSLQYLAEFEPFLAQGIVQPNIIAPPPMLPVPRPRWLLRVYGYDVLSRLEEVKARVTSTFGSILKMNSTKKVTKKLAGAAAGTAAWSTNVGNEFGQVLMSVLTSHKGEGLLPMAAGLMQRYQKAGEAPPKLLYVDRDCCSLGGVSKAAAMFPEWDQLVVRLDVWHLMRRFAAGCTTESHQLYGTFMGRLSASIFQWAEEDVALLMEAKRSELEGKQWVFGLTDAEVSSRISKKELALHCRRRTRGAEETARLLEELIETFDSGKGLDTMGIPLLDHDRIQAIWLVQRRHLRCIQDPPGVQLYTKIGQLKKGGMMLPVYHCARGSTSLESFHLHLNRFIPGTSASAMHFQAYLLEGLVRWNEDRATAAVEGPRQILHSYSGSLQHALNRLSQKLLGCSLVEDFTKPGEYTGELIGVEYLYSQTGSVLQAVDLDPDAPDEAADEDLDVEDEGFEDDEVEDPTIPGLVHLLAVPSAPQVSVVPVLSAVRSGQVDVSWPSFPQKRQRQASPQTSPQTSPRTSPQASPRALAPAGSPVRDPEESYGPDGAPGYQHIQRLASSLVSLRGLACLTEQKVDELIQLWSLLPEGDKQCLTYPARHQDRLIQGRFKATKATSSVTPGMDSLKRCLLGQGSGPAQWPQTSRLVEAICIQLCHLHPSPTKSKGVRTSRWAAILSDYSKVRELVLGSPRLMEKTTLQLFELNQHTLSQWHNKRQKGQEQAVLQQGVAPPSASVVDPEPQPQLRPLLQEGMTYGHQRHVFTCPPNTADQAKQQKRPGATAQTAVLDHSATPAPHPTSSLSTSSAAGAAAAAPPPVPRTTSWRHKKRAEEEEGGSNTGKRKYERKRAENLCSLCGQPKRKEFGHSRFGNVAFCSASSGKTVEQWLAEMRAKKK
ncbi:UNVERIFIED_CONTAM: hypothetical protein FKN15_031627 [Acipenser sinensis]